jgi:hypothetical protein
MQYFTPQEMAGGMRYGGKCKVGNWNESATLDEVRFRAKSLHAFVRRASLVSSALPRLPLTPRFPRPPQIRAQEYLAKKQAGTLKTDQHNRRMAKALAPVRRPFPRRPNSATLASRASAKRALRCFFFFWHHPKLDPLTPNASLSARRSP